MKLNPTYLAPRDCSQGMVFTENELETIASSQLVILRDTSKSDLKFQVSTDHGTTWEFISMAETHNKVRGLQCTCGSYDFSAQGCCCDCGNEVEGAEDTTEPESPSLELTTRNVPPHLNCTFTSSDGSVMLKLTEKGFEYKGQVIEDAGEAHTLFVNLLRTWRLL